MIEDLTPGLRCFELLAGEIHAVEFVLFSGSGAPKVRVLSAPSVGLERTDPERLFRTREEAEAARRSMP